MVKSTLSSIAALVLLVAVSVISLRASQPARSKVPDPVSFAPVVTRLLCGLPQRARTERQPGVGQRALG